jgi:hypothetical protein
VNQRGRLETFSFNYEVIPSLQRATLSTYLESPYFCS